MSSFFFGWEGSPTKIDHRKKKGYHLILTSPLEDLVLIQANNTRKEHHVDPISMKGALQKSFASPLNPVGHPPIDKLLVEIHRGSTLHASFCPNMAKQSKSVRSPPRLP